MIPDFRNIPFTAASPKASDLDAWKEQLQAETGKSYDDNFIRTMEQIDVGPAKNTFIAGRAALIAFVTAGANSGYVSSVEHTIVTSAFDAKAAATASSTVGNPSFVSTSNSATCMKEVTKSALALC